MQLSRSIVFNGNFIRIAEENDCMWIVGSIRCRYTNNEFKLWCEPQAGLVIFTGSESWNTKFTRQTTTWRSGGWHTWFNAYTEFQTFVRLWLVWTSCQVACLPRVRSLGIVFLRPRYKSFEDCGQNRERWTKSITVGKYLFSLDSL